MLLPLSTHRKHTLLCCISCLCFLLRSQRTAECAPIVLLYDAVTQRAAGCVGSPRPAPCQVAGSLTEWVFAGETGDERTEFLSLVEIESAAAEIGIRVSTLGGSADAEQLVTTLFSGFSATRKALGFYKASCRYWISSLR